MACDSGGKAFHHGVPGLIPPRGGGGRTCRKAAGEALTALYAAFYFSNWCNVVGIVARPRAGGSGVQFRQGTRDFSLIRNVHTGSGVYPTGNGVFVLQG